MFHVSMQKTVHPQIRPVKKKLPFAVNCITSKLKKWGKKLVRGVKNF